MTMRVPCPNCGPRSIEEWVHGEIPVVPHTITDPDARDVDRAYMHTNAPGPVREAWFHLYGCRRWVTLRRDTATDEWLTPPDSP